MKTHEKYRKREKERETERMCVVFFSFAPTKLKRELVILMAYKSEVGLEATFNRNRGVLR